jgi:hypothetical protein
VPADGTGVVYCESGDVGWSPPYDSTRAYARPCKFLKKIATFLRYLQ